MKTPVKSERELISRIEKRLPSPAGGLLRLGIGDDCAVLRARPGRELVVSCDFLIEARHFLLDAHSADSADSIGWKSLARATSDIAAMGGEAKCFLLSLALPKRLTGRWLDAFLGGMARAARSFGMVVAGGDTTLHEKVILNITVLGEVKIGRSIRRSGARPGDLICVTGRLGEAQLGLDLVRERKLLRKSNLLREKRGKQRKLCHGWEAALRKHLYPEPRLALGQWLAENRLATAMIDTSDGLSSDLGNICEASGVGARLFAEKIPAVAVPSMDLATAKNPRKLALRGNAPLDLAVHGGEDYELLFTVPRSKAGRLPARSRGVPLTIIGEITRKKGVIIIHRGKGPSPLISQGWDPFRSR